MSSPKLPGCLATFGMEEEVIPDSAITASSEFDFKHQAFNARLHFQGRVDRFGSWSAKINDELQWLQIFLGNWSRVAGLSVQGKHIADQWVKTFSISHSYDGVLFKDYYEEGGKKVLNICISNISAVPLVSISATDCENLSHLGNRITRRSSTMVCLLPTACHNLNLVLLFQSLA